MRDIVAAALLGAALLAASFVGGCSYHKQKADAQAAKERAAAMEAQRKMEVEYERKLNEIQSNAGRAAIANYLRKHRLLQQQTCGSQKPNESTCECGIAERFATACAIDAQTVESWQKWARANKLEIGD